MKKLSHFIVLFFSIIYQNSQAQTDILHDSRVDPLLKQAAAGQPGLVISGRKDASRYVNMAVLDRNRKTLTWFTCHGIAYDSAQLLDIEYNHIISKTLDPFDFYKDFCLENLSYLENAESQFRQLGNAALKDTFHNRQVVYSSLPVKSAASTLQKVMAIESLIKKQCLQLYLFDSRSPAHLLRNDSFLLRKSLAGKMVRKRDTTTYHNTYLFGSAAKIVLYKQKPQKMFVYNGQEHLIDSVPLKPEKYATLVKAKEDVFLLYRGWLELQSQQVLDATQQVESLLNRQDTSLYTQTYRLENKRQLQLAMSQLKEQQNVVEHKISGLIVPDQQMVEYMLKDAYQDAPSEISYLPGLGFAYSISYIRGQKVYELTDHRGNVMATISDKKKGVDENGDGIVEYYNADVVNANDYYPFGALMPERTYAADNKYRYGFNGKENDNEVKGEGNQQDYGMRIYDPRVGRFLSVDPLTKSYPMLTPYQFASNKPINSIDLDGLESWELRTPLHNLTQQVQITDHKEALQKRMFTQQMAMGQTVIQQSEPNFSYAAERKRAISAQLTYKREMEERASLDPVSYGGPNFGQGMVRDPATQISAAIVAPEIGIMTSGLFVYGGIKNGDYLQAGLGALGMFGSSIQVFNSTTESLNITLGVKNNGGYSFGLANKTGAPYFTDWETLGIYNQKEWIGWGSAFQHVTGNVLSSNGKIHFELEGLNVAEALAGNPKVWVGRYTAWELQQVVGSKELFKSTTFYLKGVKQSAEQLKSIGIELPK